MNNTIFGLEESIAATNARIAFDQEILRKLEEKLEEAKKPKFQPYTVSIAIESEEDARVLHAIAGRNMSTAGFLIEERGALGGIGVSNAGHRILKLLAPVYQKHDRGGKFQA